MCAPQHQNWYLDCRYTFQSLRVRQHFHHVILFYKWLLSGISFTNGFSPIPCPSRSAACSLPCLRPQHLWWWASNQNDSTFILTSMTMNCLGQGELISVGSCHILLWNAVILSLLLSRWYEIGNSLLDIFVWLVPWEVIWFYTGRNQWNQCNKGDMPNSIP